MESRHLDCERGQPIRVLHIADPSQAFAIDGPWRLLARQLPRDRFEVRQAVLANYGSPRRRVPVSASLDPEFETITVRGLRHLIGQWSPRIVHAWDVRSLSKSVFALGLNSHVGILVSLHELSFLDWRMAVWLRLLARWSFRTVAANESVKSALLQISLSNERVVVVEPGVEQIGAEPHVERAELTSLLDVPTHARLICAAGPLRWSTGLQHLMWATDLIKTVMDDVFLVIVGSGPDEWRLRRFCRQVRIEDRTRWVGERFDIRPWLAHFDCFWSACCHGRNVHFMLEAMTRGVPVVGTDIEPHRRLVVDGQTGYLVRQGDRSAFARHVWRLLRQPELAREMGANAKDRAARHFSAERMIQSYMRLYDELWWKIAHP